jgi:hypothetical protein
MLQRVTVAGLLVLVTLLLCALMALISSVFLYAGWNWDLVPVTGLHPLTDVFRAFWLAFGLTVLGSLVKGASAKVE